MKNESWRFSIFRSVLPAESPCTEPFLSLIFYSAHDQLYIKKIYICIHVSFFSPTSFSSSPRGFPHDLEIRLLSEYMYIAHYPANPLRGHASAGPDLYPLIVPDPMTNSIIDRTAVRVLAPALYRHRELALALTLCIFMRLLCIPPGTHAHCDPRNLNPYCAHTESEKT